MMNIEEFENLFGTLSSVAGYNEYLLHVARRTGRTTALIKALPNDRNFVVVSYTQLNSKYLRELVRERRPDIDIQKGHFISLGGKFTNENLYEHDALIGTRGPVFYDNHVTDMFLNYHLCKANNYRPDRTTKQEKVAEKDKDRYNDHEELNLISDLMKKVGDIDEETLSNFLVKGLSFIKAAKEMKK